MVTIESIVEKVREEWLGQGLPALTGPVLVGFSGGPDSTALVLILQALGVEQRVVHFDHELRSASAADAAWCRAFCERRGLVCEVRKLGVNRAREGGESVEMAARRLRLAAWRQMSVEAGGMPVVLGHHEDDVVETMLMRLLRGANSTGLTGLRSLRVVEGVTLWRPLLSVSRAEIEAFLTVVGVDDWRIDDSNSDPSFLRNRVRGELLPLMRDLGRGDVGLRRSAKMLLDDALSLEALAEGGELTVSGLRELAPSLRLRALREWGRATGCGDLVLSRGSVEKLVQILEQADGERRRLELADGRWLVLEKDQLAIVDQLVEPVSWAPLSWSWREQPALQLPTGDVLRATIRTDVEKMVAGQTGCCFDAAELPSKLMVRPRIDGERMVPFGGDCAVRVKKLLANTGLSRGERERAVVVVNSETDDVLWLAPFRRGAVAPVTAATREAVQLTFVSASSTTAP